MVFVKTEAEFNKLRGELDEYLSVNGLVRCFEMAIHVKMGWIGFLEILSQISRKCHLTPKELYHS